MSFISIVPSLVLPYRFRYSPRILPTLAQTTLVILCTNVVFLAEALNRNIGIAFTNLPESRIAPPGDRVFFNCETNIGKDEQIRWLHNGAELGQREDVKITQNQLAIKVRKSKRKNHRQTGRYLCVAGMGDTYIMSEPARLHIAHLDKFPARSTPPDVEANDGNDVMLACNPPESQPPAIIQWYKDDKLLNYTDNIQLINLKHLLLIDVNSTDAGLFTCQASNHLTREVTKHPEPLNLTVLTPEEKHKPRLLFEPETEYHPTIGEDLTIPCSASGFPKPTIFWTHTAFNAVPKPVNTPLHGLLSIENAGHNDTGEYTCHIFNGRGRKILRRTIVTVFEKPKCTIYTNNTEPFNEGDSLELFCEAVGFPLPQIHWVVNGNRKHRDNPLFIEKLAISDAGIYQCFSENKVGTSSDTVILPIIPKMMNATNAQRKNSRKKNERDQLVPPNPPNVTKLSEDSVMLTWSVPNVTQNIQFFKVQFRDLGTKEDRHKSDWQTVDGEIDPHMRSFEVPGLYENHLFRFRIGAVINNDNILSNLSKRFHLEKNDQKRPSLIPHISNVLQLGETSLSIQWTVPEAINEKVEGYFIHYRESTSAGPYHKITIFGEATHSHIIDHLKPGAQYEIKVRAFNLAGPGPFSIIRYQKTLPRKKRKHRKNKTALQKHEKPKVEDKDVTLYLIIGVSLGVVTILLITACSVVTYVQRQKSRAKFNETNVAIHSKYQDASLQISQYEGRQNQEQIECRTNGVAMFPVSSQDTGVHETSFSVTDHSFGGHDTQDSISQGSTALAQDSSRNLNYTNSITPDGASLGHEEYTDEPSRLSWKRRRKSEEIL